MAKNLVLKLSEVSFQFKDSGGGQRRATITPKGRRVSCGYPGVGSHSMIIPILKLDHFPEHWRKSISRKRIPAELLRSDPLKSFKSNKMVIEQGYDNHFGESEPRKVPLDISAFEWMFFLFADFVPFPYKRMLSGTIRDFLDHSMNIEEVIFSHTNVYPYIQAIDWGYSAQVESSTGSEQPDSTDQADKKKEQPVAKVTTNLTTIAWLMQRAEVIRARK